MKYRTPYCLYSLFAISSRNNENLLLARPNQGIYVTERTDIWNNCVKLILENESLSSINVANFKDKLKNGLLNIQNAFEWYTDLNFSLKTLNKQ